MSLSKRLDDEMNRCDPLDDLERDIAYAQWQTYCTDRGEAHLTPWPSDEEVRADAPLHQIGCRCPICRYEA